MMPTAMNLPAGISQDSLLKALRHDVPEAAETAARVGLGDDGDAVVQILKTYNLPSSGKVSLAKVLGNAE